MYMLQGYQAGFVTSKNENGVERRYNIAGRTQHLVSIIQEISIVTIRPSEPLFVTRRLQAALPTIELRCISRLIYCLSPYTKLWPPLAAQLRPTQILVCVKKPKGKRGLNVVGR